MFKHNLTAVLNPQRPDKFGKFPLRIRITVKRKVSYYPTGIMLHAKEWDQVNKKIILHSQKVLLNLTLNKRIAEIESQYLEGELIESTKNEKDFYKYVEKKIKANELLRSKATTTHHYSYLQKLKSFKKLLLFSEINPELLTNFENFCRLKNNINNTIWSATKFFKTYINMAIREGVLKQNPIKNFEGTKYKDPARCYLTATEIDNIELLLQDATLYTPYRNAALWFLFSCYSGLRYGDAFNYDKASHGNNIIIQTEKTGSSISIVIHPKLKSIIDKLDSKLTSNQDYNRNLKAVAQLASINKPLTSHIARHTFAVQFLERGGSMEVLSKLLGHTSIKTTQIYGKITNKRIDAEMLEVWK
jgi:site-specific recombinase XerD